MCSTIRRASDPLRPPSSRSHSSASPNPASWPGDDEGEILGIALFGDLADGVDDEARRDELAILCRLEERTAETLRGLLRDLGVTPEPGAESERLGHDVARWAASVGETEYLATLEPWGPAEHVAAEPVADSRHGFRKQ